jgi:hypothetical protein
VLIPIAKSTRFYPKIIRLPKWSAASDSSNRSAKLREDRRRKIPMKKIILLTLLLSPVCSIAAEEDDIGLTAHDIFDNRISLGLSTKVKHRQLVNMRAQMQATQTIIGLLAEKKFE